MPLQLIHYICIWVLKNNPWPVVETLSAKDSTEAIALCKEQLATVETLGRIQLRLGDDILWDSMFGESYWTVSQQQAIELHIVSLLRATGLTDKQDLTAFELQMLLAELTRKVKES